MAKPFCWTTGGCGRHNRRSGGATTAFPSRFPKKSFARYHIETMRKECQGWPFEATPKRLTTQSLSTRRLSASSCLAGRASCSTKTTMHPIKATSSRAVHTRASPRTRWMHGTRSSCRQIAGQPRADTQCVHVLNKIFISHRSHQNTLAKQLVSALSKTLLCRDC